MANLTVAQAKVAMTSANDAQIEAACKARKFKKIGTPAQNRAWLKKALDSMQSDQDSGIDEALFPPIIVINPTTPKSTPRMTIHARRPFKGPGTSKIRVDPEPDDEEEDEDDGVAETAKKTADKVVKKVKAEAKKGGLKFWGTVVLVIAILALMWIAVTSADMKLFIIGLVVAFGAYLQQQ